MADNTSTSRHTYICPDEARPLLRELKELELHQRRELNQLQEMQPTAEGYTAFTRSVDRDSKRLPELSRCISAMCRGDGSAALEALGMFGKKNWIGRDGKPTATSPLFAMQNQATRPGQHVLHEISTGRNWIFSPKLTDSLAAVSEQIRALLERDMPAGGVFRKGRKTAIYSSSKAEEGTYVNWQIHHLATVRSEYDKKENRESYMWFEKQGATRTEAEAKTLGDLLTEDERARFGKSGPFLFSFLAGYRSDFDPRPKSGAKRKVGGGATQGEPKRRRVERV